MFPRVNYYAILSLDPKYRAGKDSNHIKAAIAKRKTEAGTGRGKANVGAILTLALARQMEDALAKDPSTWEKHRTAYEKSLKIERKRVKAQIKEALDVLGGEEISSGAKAQLVRVFSDEKAIDSALKAKGLGVVQEQRESGDPEFKRSFKTALGKLDIARALVELFQQSDLYGVLSVMLEENVAATSTMNDLGEALKRLRDKKQSLDKDHGAVLTKVEDIISVVYSKEGSAGENGVRRVFDDLVELEAEVPVGGFFDMLKKAKKDPRQVERLISLGKHKTKLGERRVRQLVHAYIEEKRITEYGNSTTNSIWLCTCGEFNGEHQKVCHACGASREFLCENCEKRYDRSTHACPDCGVTQDNSNLGSNRLGQARSAFGVGNLAESESALATARKLLPRSKAIAALGDQLAKERRGREEKADAERKAKDEKAERERQAKDAVRKEVEALLLRRELWAAKKKLVELPGEVLSDDLFSRLGTKIDAGLSTAQAKIADAQKAPTSGETAIAERLARDTLSLVADHPQVETVLSSIPPDQPSGLKVAPGDGEFRLVWSRAGVQEDTKFHVLRTLDRQAISAIDGEVIFKGSRKSHVDDSFPSGRKIFYSVWGLRGTLFSNSAALSGPHVALSPVVGLVATPTDREIALTWQLPVGATNVEIRRSEANVDGSPGADTKLLGLATSAWVDKAVRTGSSYRYDVVVAYTVADGRDALSAPVSVVSALREMPSTIDTFERRGDALIWSPPPATTERDGLLAFPGDAGLTRDEVRSINQVPKPVLLEIQPGGTEVSLGELPGGKFRFWVVRHKGDSVRFCKSLDVEISRPLEGERLCTEAGRTFLNWNWPDGCTAVEVMVETESGVRRLEEVARSTTPNGKYEIANVGLKALNVSLRAVFGHDGTRFVVPSPVVLKRKGVLDNTLDFSLRTSGKRWPFSRTMNLTLKLEKKERLPAFEVRFDVARRPGLGQGTLIWQQPKSTQPIIALDIPVDLKHIEKRGFFNIVFVDPVDQERIKIVPGANAQLR